MMIRFSKTHALALVAAVGLCSALVTTAQPPEGDRERRGDRDHGRGESVGDAIREGKDDADEGSGCP